MVAFVAFLALTIIVLPMVPLSQLGRVSVSLAFALTTILGAVAIVRHRIVIYLVTGLTGAGFVAGLIGELAPTHSLPELDTTLKLIGLAILATMTLKQTLRPGQVTVYRVVGGIAGYLLIGFMWTYAYQLLLEKVPGAIHFPSVKTEALSALPGDLIYFSFVTLTTLGYGDANPVHPAARSLAVAEALVGQLYLAILIASLVGMALQAKSVIEDAEKPAANPELPR